MHLTWHCNFFTPCSSYDLIGRWLLNDYCLVVVTGGNRRDRWLWEDMSHGTLWHNMCLLCCLLEMATLPPKYGPSWGLFARFLFFRSTLYDRSLAEFSTLRKVAQPSPYRFGQGYSLTLSRRWNNAHRHLFLLSYLSSTYFRYFPTIFLHSLSVSPVCPSSFGFTAWVFLTARAVERLLTARTE